MKKILFFLFTMWFCLPSFAQTDIRTLYSKNAQSLISQFGKPEVEDHGYYYDCADGLIYNDTKMFLEEVERNGVVGRSLVGFVTKSNKYCFLSDIYPGGIKVGTKLSDLQKFNFVNCKYGKKISDNGLRQYSTSEHPRIVFDKKATHILFEKNYRFYYFTVENGVIVEWRMSVKADASPNPNVASSGGATAN